MKTIERSIIEKQDEYIAYLIKAIKSENIIDAVTAGVRNKYKSELSTLKSRMSEEPIISATNDNPFGAEIIIKEPVITEIFPDTSKSAKQYNCEEPVIAKSGRQYKSIPDGMDVEAWDTMTPVERLNYKGLIQEKEPNGVHDTCDGCAMFTDDCQLDVSICPDCFEHSMWTPKKQEDDYTIKELAEEYEITASDIHAAIRCYIKGHEETQPEALDGEKELQRQKIIEVMQADDKDGLYESLADINSQNVPKYKELGNIGTIERQIIEKQDELIEWLNSECPGMFPPLEPYTTADLSHGFCEGLRNRLDDIFYLKSQLKDENDFPEIDFRKDIANELSRDELINRLCEMNELYQKMQKEWFEKCELQKAQPGDEDIWNAAKEYAEENGRAFYTEYFEAFKDGATECRDNNIYIAPKQNNEVTMHDLKADDDAREERK